MEMSQNKIENASPDLDHESKSNTILHLQYRLKSDRLAIILLFFWSVILALHLLVLCYLCGIKNLGEKARGAIVTQLSVWMKLGGNPGLILIACRSTPGLQQFFNIGRGSMGTFLWHWCVLLQITWFHESPKRYSSFQKVKDFWTPTANLNNHPILFCCRSIGLGWDETCVHLVE